MEGVALHVHVYISSQCRALGVALQSIPTISVSGIFLFHGLNAYLWLEFDTIHTLLGKPMHRNWGSGFDTPSWSGLKC